MLSNTIIELCFSIDTAVNAWKYEETTFEFMLSCCQYIVQQSLGDVTDIVPLALKRDSKGLTPNSDQSEANSLQMFSGAYDKGLSPGEFVSSMRKSHQLILVSNFPKCETLKYAMEVETITTAKKDNLILNVTDGFMLNVIHPMAAYEELVASATLDLPVSCALNQRDGIFSGLAAARYGKGMKCLE